MDWTNRTAQATIIIQAPRIYQATTAQCAENSWYIHHKTLISKLFLNGNSIELNDVNHVLA